MVKAPVLCSDLGEKDAGDLLYKDDPSEHRSSIATHTAGGVVITLTEIKKSDLLLADASAQRKNKNVTADVKVNIPTDVKVDTYPNAITSSEIKADVKVNIAANSIDDEINKVVRDIAFVFIGINLYVITQMMILVMAKKISSSPRCNQKAVLILVSLSVMSFGLFGVPSLLLHFRAAQRRICEDIQPSPKDRLHNVLRLIFLTAGLCLATYRVIHAIYVILGC